MTIPNLISRAELTDGRRSVGRGRVTKQASTVLALIENQTASYIAHTAQTMNHLLADTKVGALPSNFLAALALSRSTRPPLTIEDLERYAPEWAKLAPQNPEIRAAVAYWLAQKYRFTYGATPRLRANLGLDGPAVQAAYQQLFAAPLAAIFADAAAPPILPPAELEREPPHHSHAPPTGAAATLGLQVVAADQLFPHEHYDAQRVARLAARIAGDGLLVNPPLVVALPHDQGFMVLDGATRTTAFQQLGYSHIVVQVVEQTTDPLTAAQGVQLNTWFHGVRGSSAHELLALAQSVNGLQLRHLPLDQLRQKMWECGALGYLITADGTGFLLEPTAAPAGPDWLQALTTFVDQYSDWGRVERTLVDDLAVLRQQFTDLAGLVVFPQFALDVLLQLVAKGRLMPAGITRFLVPGRVLRLNAPLAMLISAEPIAAKRAWLDDLVQTRLAQGAVRHYQETVVVMDE